MKTLEGHEDNVRVLAVGEHHVFSGSWDKTIRVRGLHVLQSLLSRSSVLCGLKRLCFLWLVGRKYDWNTREGVGLSGRQLIPMESHMMRRTQSGVGLGHSGVLQGLGGPS